MEISVYVVRILIIRMNSRNIYVINKTMVYRFSGTWRNH